MNLYNFLRDIFNQESDHFPHMWLHKPHADCARCFFVLRLHNFPPQSAGIFFTLFCVYKSTLHSCLLFSTWSYNFLSDIYDHKVITFLTSISYIVYNEFDLLKVAIILTP